jgi:hypothetical protein
MRCEPGSRLKRADSSRTFYAPCRASHASRPAPLVIALTVLIAAAPGTGYAWGPQGHRLIAEIAAAELTPAARAGVASLLGSESLADIASWADTYRWDNNQTSGWHFVNIPREARAYDRNRDCPRQPAVRAGTRGDRWRDCAIDRIGYHAARLADHALDAADRAIALKFLVHLVGDLHQPFHALKDAQGGNDIPVSVLGSADCGSDAGTPHPCELHGVWDSTLLSYRHWNDAQYRSSLRPRIERLRRSPAVAARVDAWAMESHDAAVAALVQPGAAIGTPYLDTNAAVVDDRLVLAGLRLARLINTALP